MGQERKIEDVDRDSDDAVDSRRHRPASEIRFVKGTLPVSFLSTGSLTDELRAWLWEIVHTTLLAPHAELDRWTAGVSGRPTVRRVWTATPISGDPDRIPEDVADVLEGWFSLVEPADVYAFIEAVHDSLEVPLQPRFASSINAALERGMSDHRFVLRRMMPIASKADIAAIERALAACPRAHWNEPEARLRDAIARLAEKPQPDARGAIQEAIRAVQDAAHALTKERHFDLEDALQDLRAKGHIDSPLETAYSGLFAYITSATRRPTTDDARIILVMCAGFVSHLASRIPLAR